MFSPEEADLLDSLDVPFYKVASMDVVNLPLLEYVAAKRRPIVLATGMATLGEIEQAVEVIRAAGNHDVALLHCVSIYPPDYESIRLLNIPMLRDVFDVPVGFSDHTLGDVRASCGYRPGRVHYREALHHRQGHGGLGPRHLSRPSRVAGHRRGGPPRLRRSRWSRAHRRRGGDREAQAVPPQPGDQACASAAVTP